MTTLSNFFNSHPPLILLKYSAIKATLRDNLVLEFGGGRRRGHKKEIMV